MGHFEGDQTAVWPAVQIILREIDPWVCVDVLDRFIFSSDGEGCPQHRVTLDQRLEGIFQRRDVELGTDDKGRSDVVGGALGCHPVYVVEGLLALGEEKLCVIDVPPTLFCPVPISFQPRKHQALESDRRHTETVQARQLAEFGLQLSPIAC